MVNDAVYLFERLKSLINKINNNVINIIIIFSIHLMKGIMDTTKPKQTRKTRIMPKIESRLTRLQDDLVFYQSQSKNDVERDCCMRSLDLVRKLKNDIFEYFLERGL